MSNKTNTTNPLGLPLTHEHQAWADKMSHIPDRVEVRELLAKYYMAPITDDAVMQLEASFQEILSNPGWERPYHEHFASPTRWRGKAWNEDFSEDRRFMTPSDLVLMLANMKAKRDASFPQPRLYCPTSFVGTWEQIVPQPTLAQPCMWHLQGDGSLSTNSPDTPTGLSFWSVIRSYTSYGDRLVLLETPDSGPWSICGITPTATELTGVHLGYVENIEFRLRRADPEPDGQ